MNTNDNAMAEGGLQFFGQMTASVSHEIKNCLAIMNESAGLLQDLMALSRRGTPVDSERVDRVAGQITAQIQRADAVVKNLNGFAHSIDVPIKSADLGEVLSLSLKLAERFAANRGVEIKLSLPDDRIVMSTHPFFLMNLIWRCLDYAMSVVRSDKTINVDLGSDGGLVEIVFRNLEQQRKTTDERAFRENIEALLGLLGAELHPINPANQMRLVFSRLLPK